MTSSGGEAAVTVATPPLVGAPRNVPRMHSPRRPPGQRTGNTNVNQSGVGELFPPINGGSGKRKEAATLGRYDAVGRCVPRSTKPSDSKNKVNQCALKTMLLARGFFRNNLYTAPTLAGMDYNGPPDTTGLLPAPSSPTKEERGVLGVIAKRMAEPHSLIDLSSSGVTDTFMVALCSVIASHPTVTDLDLSGNPFTENSSRNLLEAVTQNKRIVRVDLTGSKLSPDTVTAIETMCDEHERRRIGIEDKRAKRTQKKERRKADRKAKEAVTRVLDSEREERGAIRDEASSTYSTELLSFHKTVAWQQRKEQRMQLRKQRLGERYALCDAETDARGGVWVEEEMGRRMVLTPVEQATRSLVTDEQLAVRARLKKEENSDWVLSKRAEKTRLRLYAEQRLNLEMSEDTTRGIEMEHFEAAVAKLEEDGEESRQHYAELLQERLDLEAAIRRKKQQEEARLEQERQWKRDAEARERARKETEHARARDKDKRIETSKRQKIEKDEESIFALFVELEKIGLDVAKARQHYFNAERNVVKCLGTQPSLVMQGMPCENQVNFIGANARFNDVFEVSGSVVDMAFAALGKLEDEDARRTKWKTKYLNAVGNAETALSARIVDLQPVLLPDIPRPPELDRPTAGERGTSTKNLRSAVLAARSPDSAPISPLAESVDLASKQAAESDYRDSLMAAAQAGSARLWFNPAEAEAEVKKSVVFDHSNVTGMRKRVVGARLQAVVVDEGVCEEDVGIHRGRCEFQHPAQDADSLGVCGFSKPVERRLDYEFYSGTAWDDIAATAKALQYRSTLPSSSWWFGSKVVEVLLSVTIPAIDPTTLDAHGRLMCDDPFGSCTVDMKGSVKMKLKIQPHLMQAPQASLSLNYMEGTAIEKFQLCRRFQVSPYVHWQEQTPVQLDAVGSAEPGEDGDDTESVVTEAASTPGKRPLQPHELRESGHNYNGGRLLINFTVNYSDEDELLLRKSDANNSWNPTPDGDALYRGGSGGTLLANVTQGLLVDTRKREETGRPQSSQTYEICFVHDSCTPRFVHEVLKRLRFANTSQDPSVLQRTIEVTLFPPRSTAGYTIPIQLVVECEDDPTELIVPQHKLIYRAEGPDGPDQLKQYLKKSELPLFPGAKLVDPDTEYVHCGRLRVTANGAQKGDCIYIKERGELLRVDAQGTVLYFGTPVGTVHAQKTPDTIDIEFYRHGEACLAFIQCLLRCIHFHNENADPPAGRRQYELNLELGPSVAPRTNDDDEPEPIEECPADAELDMLKDTVEVRVACELFDIQNHWNIEYKEGSGPVRLAPFDVKLEQHAMVDSWLGGHILVEVVQGGNEDDVLNLRTPHVGKDGDYRYAVRKDQCLSRQERALVGWGARGGFAEAVMEATGGNEDDDGDSPRPPHGRCALPPAQHIVDQLGPADTPSDSDQAPSGSDCSDGSGDGDVPPAPDSSMAMTMGLSLGASLRRGDMKDRLRDKVQQMVKQKLETKEKMAKNLSAATTESGKKALKVAEDRAAAAEGMKFYDIMGGGKKIATFVHVSGTVNKVLVRFITKVTRKDVLAICRFITYSNMSSDPSELTKIIRIELRDGGCVASQAMMQIDILNVDDVTEIMVENNRRKYRPGMKDLTRLGCFPVTGFYRLKLHDPDTSHLDGGSVGCELVGGGVKGDSIGFMTTEQQQRAIETGLEYRQSLMAKEGEEAPDKNAIHYVDLPPGPLEIREGKKLYDTEDRHVGTIETPNSKVAGCNNVKVTFPKFDPPVITLELAAYIMSCFTFSASWENGKLAAGQRVYNLKVLDPENPTEGKERMMIDVNKPIFYSPAPSVRRGKPGEGLVLIDRVTVQVGEKQGSMMQSGFTQAYIVEGAQPGDLLSFSPGSGGINVKDSQILCGLEFLGRTSSSGGYRLRMEHSWASKLTTKALTSLLQSITFKASTPGRRVIEVLVSDGTEPNMEQCVVEIE